MSVSIPSFISLLGPTSPTNFPRQDANHTTRQDINLKSKIDAQASKWTSELVIRIGHQNWSSELVIRIGRQNWSSESFLPILFATQE
jgi:hypothetical protein